MKQLSNFRRGLGKVEVIVIAAAVSVFAMAAIPNFSEMRIHSDVARSKRDLESIAVAMESYCTDNGQYPAAYRESPLGGSSPWSNMDPRMLTTPVAYVSGLPSDHFRISTTTPVFGYYRIYSIVYLVRTTPPYYMRSYYTYPKTAWMSWSLGPDWLTNTGGYFPLPAIIANEALAAPQIGVDRNGTLIGGSPGYNGMRYDPTNGMGSWGDIYRFSALARVRLN